MSGKTILVVDDEKKIVDVLDTYLRSAGFRVLCAYTGLEAIDQFSRGKPDLIILDLMLPDLPGEDITRIIRRTSRTPILMLTARTDEESILQGLSSGADDYVTKPFSPRQVVARVEAILRRSAENDEPSPVLAFNDQDLVIDPIRHEVKKKGLSVQLTPSEFKIILTLAKYPERTFSREELIDMALGGEYEGYARVIDTHVKNIRLKIEDDPKAPKYVQTVFGVGYKFSG
jgi:DNA-binding response OmpR family regulator